MGKELTNEKIYLKWSRVSNFTSGVGKIKWSENSRKLAFSYEIRVEECMTTFSNILIMFNLAQN